MVKKNFLNNQPTLFILVKFFLILNMVGSGIQVVVFTVAFFSSAISHSFQKSEVRLEVRRVEPQTSRELLPDSMAYKFNQSKIGDLSIMMPWYSKFFVPFGFFNGLGIDMSLPYWTVYFILCFLLFRIISSVSMESPFSDKNVRRIFWIGYTLILYDAFIFIRYIIISIFLKKTTDNAFLYNGLGPMVYYKVGILVIILAMIYRRGVAIQREQELTV